MRDPVDTYMNYLIPTVVEQIHRCDVRRMDTEKRAPTLPARVAFPDHVLRDGRLSHHKAEFEQLSMDARRTAKQIFSTHPSDQGPQIPTDLRSASQVPRFPTPVAAKSGTMPSAPGFLAE